MGVMMGLFDGVGRFGVDVESYAVYGLVRKALAGCGLLVCFGDNVIVVTSGVVGDAFVCIVTQDGLVHIDYDIVCYDPIGFDGVLSYDQMTDMCDCASYGYRGVEVVFDLADPGLVGKVVGLVYGVCGLEIKIGG
jgi:hypothetical protein